MKITKCQLYTDVFSLQRRHNERTGVSNHRHLDCLLNRLFKRRSKKTSKLCVTGLCGGNPPVTDGFSHKGPVTRKKFHLMSHGNVIFFRDVLPTNRKLGLKISVYTTSFYTELCQTTADVNESKVYSCFYFHNWTLISYWQNVSAWWRHQMETFSALLAICAGNSPVPGEFPAQRPVTQSFDVFFWSVSE